MIQFPNHAAYIFTMLTFHPTHDIAAARFLRSHETGHLATERVGETSRIIAIDAQEELPEQRPCHIDILLCGSHLFYGYLIFSLFEEDTLGMFGDIFLISRLGIRLCGILPIKRVNGSQDVFLHWRVRIVFQELKQVRLVA